MATIDVSNLTLSPQEVQGFSEFIIEQTLKRPEIKAVHALQTGIKMKSQIILAAQLGKLGISGDSSCDANSSGATTVLSQKYWEPKPIEDRLEVCQKQVDALFKAYYGKITSYKERYDITSSDEALFLAALAEEGIYNLLWRAIWFGDTAVAAATSSVAGLISSDNVKFYNYFDGLWKQIFAGVTSTDIARIVISENTETTTTDQLTFTEGRAKELMNLVFKKASANLRSNKDAQFLVSGEIFQNYREYLQTKGENFTIGYTVDGMEILKFQGKNVVNMETVWEVGTITDFVDNTTNNAYYLPNRIVFTIPANIPIGTLNEKDFSTLDTWYNKDERKTKMEFGFDLDAKVVEESMIVVAY